MMRFAGVATACALSACAMPLADDRASWGMGVDLRERAARHAQLSVAYLRHGRADVAHSEALAALGLAPSDVGVVHLMALSEAANGQADAALGYFAQAVYLDDARYPASQRSGCAGKRGNGGARGESCDTHGVHEQSPSEAHGAIKDLSERAILWSNYAVALKAAGQTERAACFFERALSDKLSRRPTSWPRSQLKSSRKYENEDANANGIESVDKRVDLDVDGGHSDQRLHGIAAEQSR